MIQLDSLFDLLASDYFKDQRSGNLFFSAYIYTYDIKAENEMIKAIDSLDHKLSRPNNSLESLSINIYSEIIEFLKSDVFLGESTFDVVLKKEKEEGTQEAYRYATKIINNERKAFYEYISKKIASHFVPNEEKRSYLFVQGFAKSYPLLHASDFLKNTENLINDFKIIVFYPGNYDQAKYSLFGEFNEDNVYRATHLNSIINQTA